MAIFSKKKIVGQPDAPMMVGPVSGQARAGNLCGIYLHVKMHSLVTSVSVIRTMTGLLDETLVSFDKLF